MMYADTVGLASVLAGVREFAKQHRWSGRLRVIVGLPRAVPHPLFRCGLPQDALRYLRAP